MCRYIYNIYIYRLALYIVRLCKYCSDICVITHISVISIICYHLSLLFHNFIILSLTLRLSLCSKLSCFMPEEIILYVYYRDTALCCYISLEKKS